MEKKRNLWVIPTDKPSRLRYNASNVLVLTEESYRDYNKLDNQHIYITSDEEIKNGDYFLDPRFPSMMIPLKQRDGIYNHVIDKCRKIILTTDPDLILDGVQAIDDEFLEWFVNNPSCESVVVNFNYKKFRWSELNKSQCYKIIIPQEEPKQIYYNTVGIENGVNVVKGQFNTQKEALDLANELNRKFPDLYYDWRETLIKEEPKQETLEEASHTAWLNYEHVEGNLYSTSFKNGFKFGANYQAERMYSEEEVMNALHSVELKHNKDYSKIYEGIKEFLNNNKKKNER
jgi:hypothetical protein